MSNKRKKVLITGGCGFIGSHVVEHFRRKTDWDIVVVDKLSYASNGFERLRDSDCLHSDRVKVMPVDFTVQTSVLNMSLTRPHVC